MLTAYYTTFPFYTLYTAEIGYWQGEGRTTDDGGQRMGDGGRTTDDEGQRIAVRPARPTVSVYFVYFVVNPLCF